MKKISNLIEPNYEKELVSEIFTDFFYKNSIKRYSRYTSFGAVFAEIFNITIRDLLGTPAFLKGYSNWIDVMPTIKSQYDNRNLSSTNLTTIQASLKRMKNLFSKNLLEKREKF